MHDTPVQRILVIGAGYVGLVTAVGLASLGHDVEVVETRPDRFDALVAGRVPIFEAGLQDAFDAASAAGRLRVSQAPGGHPDMVMVCVGTPIGSDGRSDLTQLRSALQALHEVLDSDAPLVVRSTLPPGSTQLAVEWADIPTARVLTNPEFLRQGTALEDFLHPTRIVIGHFPDADPATIARVVLCLRAARRAHPRHGRRRCRDHQERRQRLPRVEALVRQRDRERGRGVRHRRRRGPRGDDPRPAHRRAVPAPGPWLWRELPAQGAAARWPSAGWAAGCRCSSRTPRRRPTPPSRRASPGASTTWPGACRDAPSGSSALAFKAHTDDVRDSPPLAVARELLQRGAIVVAHDPQAAANAARELPELRFVEDPALALRDADIGVLGTEWPIYRDLDWAAIRPTMRTPTIIDGRRLLDGARLRDLGFRYEAVGTASAA